MVSHAYKLSPLYVNGRRVTTLIGSASISFHFQESAAVPERVRQYQVCIGYAEFLAQWLNRSRRDVAPFEIDWLGGRVTGGRIFTMNRHLTFINAQGHRRGESLAYTTFPELGQDRSSLRLELPLHPAHVVAGSPGELMKGKVSDLFVCAEVLDVALNRVRAIPIFIGHQVMQGPMEQIVGAAHGEIHPEQIDNFSKLAKVRMPSKEQLEALRAIPEQQVKTAFAAIIGEPDVPRDWGGERSDLISTYVRVGGKRISSAFLFKGPAGGEKFRPMEVRDLGKPGNQIERLATEPVDLLVVQHCHTVTAAVRSLLRAFCNQVGYQRNYCVITGYDTFRILRAYGKCNL